MLRLQKALVDQSLLNVLLIVLLLGDVLEQVLVQVLHDTVLDPFSVQLVLFFLVHRSRRKQLVERLRHFSHEILDLIPLLFTWALWLEALGQLIPNEVLQALPDRLCLLRLELEVEIMEDALVLDTADGARRALHVLLLELLHVCLSIC